MLFIWWVYMALFTVCEGPKNQVLYQGYGSTFIKSKNILDTTISRINASREPQSTSNSASSLVRQYAAVPVEDKGKASHYTLCLWISWSSQRTFFIRQKIISSLLLISCTLSFHSLYIDNKHQSKCLQLSKVMTSISSINASITSLLGNSDIIRKHNELETILTFLLYCLYHFGSAALQDDKVVCSFGIIGQINSTGLGGGAKYISSKVHFWTTASTLDRSWVNPPKTNATWWVQQQHLTLTKKDWLTMDASSITD